MTPAVREFLRQKAIRHHVPNANTLEITEEMKVWKDKDWRTLAITTEYDIMNAPQREYEAQRAAEQRDREIEHYRELCDIDVATQLADGGIDAFYALRGDLSLEQFKHVAWYMFRAVAIC